MAMPSVWNKSSAFKFVNSAIAPKNTITTGIGEVPKYPGVLGANTLNRSSGANRTSPQSQIVQQGMGGGLGGGGSAGGGAAGGGGLGAGSPQVAELRSEIAARRERANSIFAALTEAVSALTKEKRSGIESDFAREQGEALEDYTSQSNTLARTYRGRGLGDSSFKVGALEEAGDEYSDTLADLGRQRQAGLAQTGSEADIALARINADRGSVSDIDLGEIGRREDGTYDVNQLVSLKNDLDNRIREAQVQRSEFRSQKGFRGRLDEISPYKGTTTALKSALQSLVKTATPQSVKDKLASAIINNYAPDDAGTWQNFYEEESRKQTTG